MQLIRQWRIRNWGLCGVWLFTEIELFLSRAEIKLCVCGNRTMHPCASSRSGWLNFDFWKLDAGLARVVEVMYSGLPIDTRLSGSPERWKLLLWPVCLCTSACLFTFLWVVFFWVQIFTSIVIWEVIYFVELFEKDFVFCRRQLW